MSLKGIEPVTLFNQSVTGTTPISSLPLNPSKNTSAAFMIVAGAGLTATFQVLASPDNINYADIGITIPPISGSAVNIPVSVDGLRFPWVKLQITPSSGTGNVQVIGSAKGI